MAATTRKPVAKKKSPAAKKKATPKAASGKKYGPKASERVAQELHEMKRGKLVSGSGEKVTDPKQAIAIALSEARRAGGKVPPNPNGRKKAK